MTSTATLQPEDIALDTSIDEHLIPYLVVIVVGLLFMEWLLTPKSKPQPEKRMCLKVKGKVDFL